MYNKRDAVITLHTRAHEDSNKTHLWVLTNLAVKIGVKVESFPCTLQQVERKVKQ